MELRFKRPASEFARQQPCACGKPIGREGVLVEVYVGEPAELDSVVFVCGECVRRHPVLVAKDVMQVADHLAVDGHRRVRLSETLAAAAVELGKLEQFPVAALNAEAVLDAIARGDRKFALASEIQALTMAKP